MMPEGINQERGQHVDLHFLLLEVLKRWGGFCLSEEKARQARK